MKRVRSLYFKLIVLVLSVLLVLLLALGYMNIRTIRERAIETKMADLTAQAEEIAYLAGQFGMPYYNNQYLNNKAQSVYQAYGAYILVVDSNGWVADNLYSAQKDNREFAEGLNREMINETLQKALSGQTVLVTSDSLSGTVFTIAMPWTVNGTVRGAVFIHTPGQVIEAEYRPVVIQILLGFLIAALFGIVSVSLLVRRLLAPLRSVSMAADEMAKGNFEVRAQNSNTKELAELSNAFNGMAEQLKITETTRREFVSNVSHELRSPVTCIGGYVSGLLDGTIPPEEQKTTLEILKSEANRLTRLITDLLHLSRLEREDTQLQPEAFDVNELIRRSLILRMQDIEEKGVTPELRFECEEAYVFADQDRIQQVILNLLDNALKFVPEQDGVIRFSTFRRDNLVQVTVFNNGPRVPAEDQPRLFERFYTVNKAHTSGGGTGLGLSISQRIMELHHQLIRYVDVPDGASFMFTLEMAEKPNINE